MDYSTVPWQLLHVARQHTYGWEYMWKGRRASSLFVQVLVFLPKHMQLAEVRTTWLDGTFGQPSETIQFPKYMCSAFCDSAGCPLALACQSTRAELATWPALYLLPFCVFLRVPQRNLKLKWILASQLLYIISAKGALQFRTSALWSVFQKLVLDEFETCQKCSYRFAITITFALILDNRY